MLWRWQALLSFPKVTRLRWQEALYASRLLTLQYTRQNAIISVISKISQWWSVQPGSICHHLIARHFHTMPHEVVTGWISRRLMSQQVLVSWLIAHCYYFSGASGRWDDIDIYWRKMNFLQQPTASFTAKAWFIHTYKRIFGAGIIAKIIERALLSFKVSPEGEWFSCRRKSITAAYFWRRLIMFGLRYWYRWPAPPLAFQQSISSTLNTSDLIVSWRALRPFPLSLPAPFWNFSI